MRKMMIAMLALVLTALNALAADPAIQQLGRYVGTYKLATKWGGNQGSWKPFQDLTVTSTSQIYLNSVLVPSGNVTATTNGAGVVQYKMVFADGSYAQINFQSNPGAGYYFDSNVQGWGLTGAYQPNSAASGLLDLRGVPVKITDPAIQQLGQ